MESNDKRGLRRLKLPARFVVVSWRDLAVIGLPVLVFVSLVVVVAFKFAKPAPLDNIVIISGPDGSSFRNTAEKYRKIIERSGVKVKILSSQGSLDNLKQLASASGRVDVGFVQGGLTDGVNIESLQSLGSLFTQPLLVFYRGKEPIDQLSQLHGRRIAIGPEGSGTRALAMKLLKGNGMDEKPTVLVELAGDEAAAALTKGEVDVAFLMGDSATPAVMRGLMTTRGIRLLSFSQADGYLRRFSFLSKLTLPRGAVDLGKNIPAQDVQLIGPTVELISRDDLHPALSDLLIGAAREIHGGPGMFRVAGEYPAPLKKDFPISEDAERYYKSGSRFLYTHLPFWLASLTDRLLVVLIPLVVVIIPALRLVPVIYRWRVRSRVYRWYGVLMAIERDIFSSPTAEEKKEIMKRIDRVEEAVNRIKMPLSFADQLFVLRSHINMVRDRLALDIATH
ncbi:MAG TPA: TAXI family TRAP transporter solute-binding subunit [Burkholderiales bacterium]|nr:TAXI family TRAP transporter solute-binding subunit [Burkholderiales bacterium]